MFYKSKIKILTQFEANKTARKQELLSGRFVCLMILSSNLVLACCKAHFCVGFRYIGKGYFTTFAAQDTVK